MVIKKTMALDNESYYLTHLFIINGVLPNKLTPMEIVVLASFMSLTGDITVDNRLGTTARKIIKDKLELSDGGLSNYIKAFRTKGILITKDDKEMIHPNLIPNSNIQDYQFRLINKN